MLAHCAVQAQQLRAMVEHGGGHVIHDPCCQPTYHHIELEVGDLQHRATDERAVAELAFDLAAPDPELVDGKCLAGLALQFGVGNAQRGRDRVAQFLDGTHQRLVARGLESIGRMKSMLPPNEDEDGVGVRKWRLARDLEYGHCAERHIVLHRRPVAALDANILEIDAGEVQSDAEFLAAAAGEVEVNQSGPAMWVLGIGLVELYKVHQGDSHSAAASRFASGMKSPPPADGRLRSALLPNTDTTTGVRFRAQRQAAIDPLQPFNLLETIHSLVSKLTLPRRQVQGPFRFAQHGNSSPVCWCARWITRSARSAELTPDTPYRLEMPASRLIGPWVPELAHSGQVEARANTRHSSPEAKRGEDTTDEGGKCNQKCHGEDVQQHVRHGGRIDLSERSISRGHPFHDEEQKSKRRRH